MWNKDQEKDQTMDDTPDTGPEASPSGDRTRATPAAERAIIGDSIRIQGEVTGDEDLTIQGHVEGSVDLDQHSVTVGPDGDVNADVVARVITVEGHVDGDLTAEEQVVVRSSARVEGDISAPRVVLEDGAHFRGGVEMDEPAERGSRAAGGTRTRPTRASTPDESKDESVDEEKSEDEASSELTA